jgi:hypothetical protein
VSKSPAAASFFRRSLFYPEYIFPHSKVYVWPFTDAAPRQNVCRRISLAADFIRPLEANNSGDLKTAPHPLRERGVRPSSTTRIATCKPHPPPKYLILDSILTFPFHPHRSCGGVFFFFLIDSIDCTLALASNPTFSDSLHSSRRHCQILPPSKNIPSPSLRGKIWKESNFHLKKKGGR